MFSSLLTVEEVADLLKIFPRAMYKRLFQAPSERQDWNWIYLSNSVSRISVNLPFKPKRRGQRSHSRKCRYAHYNSPKGETKRSVCGVFNREESCNHF